MPRTPWITIAIPAYNRAALLERSIASVLAQQDPDWELFIVDDRSQDDAWSVGRRLAMQDDRIHALQNAENLGLAANFRHAAECGHSQYLLLLAADDTLAPEFLSIVRKTVTLDSELGLVCTRRVHVLGPSGRTRYYATPLTGRFEAGTTVARALKSGNLYGLYSSVIVHRRALEEIGGIRTDNPWAGDYETWVRIAARHPVFFNPRALAFQYIDPSTQTTAFIVNGQLIRYERETLDRLLQDDAVTRYLSPHDYVVARRRIEALRWILNIYHLRRPGQAPSPQWLPADLNTTTTMGNFLATAWTATHLLWNRYRLTY